MAFDAALGPVPIAQAIQSGLALAAIPDGPRPRAVWEFNSRLRAIALQNEQSTANDVIEADGASTNVVAAAQTARIQSRALVDQLTGYSRSLMGRASAPVRMAVNPKTVRFDQPKRWTGKDTQEGTTFYHFTNSKGQNNHYLTMSFAGNTGNLDQRAGAAATKRLQAWHNLYLLSQEPMLIGPGLENEFSIKFNSKLLPRPVTFYGFYGAVLEFEESADKPNSVDYSFEFIVNRTEPSLDVMLNEVLSFVGRTDPADVTSTVDGSLLPGDQGA